MDLQSQTNNWNQEHKLHHFLIPWNTQFTTPAPLTGSKSTSLLAQAEPLQQWLEAGRHKTLILSYNLWCLKLQRTIEMIQSRGFKATKYFLQRIRPGPRGPANMLTSHLAVFPISTPHHVSLQNTWTFVAISCLWAHASPHRRAWGAGSLCRLCGVRYDYISSGGRFSRNNWKYKHRSC